MAFKIEQRQPSGKQVKWKFETIERIFTSDVEKFKRNVQFWKQKLMVDDTVQVELLEGASFLQNHLAEERNIVDVEHEIVEENDNELTLNSRLGSTNSHIIDEQSNVDETPANIVNTPKRKPRKKTTDL